MMSRYDARYNVIAWLAACAMALGLSACGGGGGGAGAGPAGNAPASVSTGRVAVLFTDGPTTAFQHINITATAAQLLGADGTQTLFSGQKTFDLLALNSHSEIFSLADTAPGSYDKIRLTVTDIELVRQDSSGAVTDRIHPKLPGNGKLDFVPDAPIVVTGGQTLYLQLDMDAAKSFNIVQTGNGQYIFRPVVFVDVLGTDTPGKVVRLHGSIQTVDQNAQQLTVCTQSLMPSTSTGSSDSSSNEQETSVDTNTPSSHCVTVQLDDNTSLFNAQGDPALLSDLAAGDEVTVLGRFVPDTNSDQSLVLNAMVVEFGPAGTYTQLQGAVQSVADDHSSFMLSLDPGQGFAPGTVLQVLVQDGTKVFSLQGIALSSNDIGTGDVVKVEGVVVLSDTQPDSIKAAIVFVRSDATDGPVTGILGTIDVPNSSFTLITTAGDRCVTLDTGAHLFQISTTSTGFVSEAVTLADLSSAQQVDVYGPLGVGGCYLAHDVLAAAPSAPSQ